MRRTFLLCTMVAAAACGSRRASLLPAPTPAVANPPSIGCPADLAGEARVGKLPTIGFDTPSAKDGQPPVSVTCTPASGSEFPVGRTTVTCEAVDALARKASCRFDVTVGDIPRLEKTRFLAFGDSLTEGKTSLVFRGAIVVPQRTPDPVFNAPLSYVERLYGLLADRYEKQTITIIAEGYGGRTTGDDKDRERDELDQFKPDALLLMEGTNDILNFPDAPGIDSAADALQRMVRDAKSRGVVVFLATLPPVNSHAPGFQNKAEAEAVLPLLNERIRNLAATEHVTLVDMFTAIPVTEIGNDGVHPKGSGYVIMAAEWLKAIMATMEVRSAGLSTLR